MSCIHRLDHKGLLLLATLSLAATGGCVADGGSDRGDGSTISEPTSTRQAGIALRTRFVLEGVDEIADVAMLDELSFHVGAIFLEPLDPSQNNVAFASRRPFSLTFDIESGVAELHGPPMNLPITGDFAVSLQIEPEERDAGRVTSAPPSVDVQGRWLYDVGAFDQDGFKSDEPSPLPWRPASDEPSPLPWRQGADDAKDLRRADGIQRWVDFQYRSDRVARIFLNDVRLDESGDYELVLRLPVDRWVEETVVPAVQAELADREPTLLAPRGGEPEEAVSIGAALDEDGVGLEGLIGGMDASAERVPTDR